MVANCFYNGMGSTIANREPFAGDAANKKFTARCPIECYIADDNVVFGSECTVLRRVNNKVSSR